MCSRCLLLPCMQCARADTAFAGASVGGQWAAAALAEDPAEAAQGPASEPGDSVREVGAAPGDAVHPPGASREPSENCNAAEGSSSETSAGGAADRAPDLGARAPGAGLEDAQGPPNPKQAPEEPDAAAAPSGAPSVAAVWPAEEAGRREGGAPGRSGSSEGSGLRLGFLDPLGMLEKVTDVFSRRVHASASPTALSPKPTREPPAAPTDTAPHAKSSGAAGTRESCEASTQPHSDLLRASAGSGGADAGAPPRLDIAVDLSANQQSPTAGDGGEGKQRAPASTPQQLDLALDLSPDRRAPAAAGASAGAPGGRASAPLPLPELIAELPPAPDRATPSVVVSSGGVGKIHPDAGPPADSAAAVGFLGLPVRVGAQGAAERGTPAPGPARKLRPEPDASGARSPEATLRRAQLAPK